MFSKLTWKIFSHSFTAHCESAITGFLKIGSICRQNINNCEQYMEFKSVEDYFIHPDFNDNTFHNDLALVKLNGRSSITPVAIDDGSFSLNYTSG